jgi:hypothetical protein
MEVTGAEVIVIKAEGILVGLTNIDAKFYLVAANAMAPVVVALVGVFGFDERRGCRSEC